MGRKYLFVLLKSTMYTHILDPELQDERDLDIFFYEAGHTQR